MKKTTLLLTFLILVVSLFAQSGQRVVSQMVAAHHDAKSPFQKVNVFAQKEALPAGFIQDKALEKGTLLTIQSATIQSVLAKAPQTIEFSLPSAEYGDLTLDLVKVNLFSPGFQVLTDASDAPVEFTPGVYYRGIIKGDNSSLAAISISENEIMGFVSDEAFGNLVLGKMEGDNPQNKHLLYADQNLKLPAGIFCGMDDTADMETLNDEQTVTDRDAGDCVSLWIEVDRDITANKGSNTTSWITGVFNQVFTLYANESIEFGINTIYVWSAGGSNKYKGNSSSVILNNFQNGRASSFTGDLAILCNLKSNAGGIAAGFAGLCNSNRRNSMCFAGLQSSYSNVPTYSWTIMVSTHELGHLLSSRHTHACVWNGNNTAIDGCSSVEGSCARPQIPPKGTIMSYCHLQGGIDFNLGFGPQPGDKIRSGVANANCLAANCSSFNAPGENRGGNLSATKIQLTPNPASDRVRLDLNVQLNPGETGLVRVMDSQGRLAQTLVFKDSNAILSMETATWTPGVYFVDVETSTEKWTTRLVIQ